MVYGLILWTACEHSSIGWKKNPLCMQICKGTQLQCDT